MKLKELLTKVEEDFGDIKEGFTYEYIEGFTAALNRTRQKIIDSIEVSVQ